MKIQCVGDDKYLEHLLGRIGTVSYICSPLHPDGPVVFKVSLEADGQGEGGDYYFDSKHLTYDLDSPPMPYSPLSPGYFVGMSTKYPGEYAYIEHPDYCVPGSPCPSFISSGALDDIDDIDEDSPAPRSLDDIDDIDDRVDDGPASVPRAPASLWAGSADIGDPIADDDPIEVDSIQPEVLELALDRVDALGVGMEYSPARDAAHAPDLSAAPGTLFSLSHSPPTIVPSLHWRITVWHIVCMYVCILVLWN